MLIFPQKCAFFTHTFVFIVQILDSEKPKRFKICLFNSQNPSKNSFV